MLFYPAQSFATESAISLRRAVGSNTFFLQQLIPVMPAPCCAQGRAAGIALDCYCHSDSVVLAQLYSTAQELTLHHPNIVNAKKNTEILYGTPTFLSRHTKATENGTL